MRPKKAVDSVKLSFNYIKGPGYREIPCDGAIGGLAPQGKLWMAFYAERYPLPRIVAYDVPAPTEGQPKVTLNESASTPSYIESREGIIRHVEFCAYLDIDGAERLRDWLTQKISEGRANTSRGRTSRSKSS